MEKIAKTNNSLDGLNIRHKTQEKRILMNFKTSQRRLFIKKTRKMISTKK